MKKAPKLSMLLLGAMLFASVSFTACGGSGDEKKDAPADSPAVAPKMETAPADSNAAKKDSPKVMNTRPNNNPPTP